MTHNVLRVYAVLFAAYQQINFGFAPNGMERAQLIFEQSFERAISNERVSLFAVLCVVC